MRKQQEMVREFQERANQQPTRIPTMYTCNGTALNARLIQEELDEYKEADNIEAVADAIGDLLVVVLGAACQHGIDIEPVFDEIHRSNMSKFIDGHRRTDGKWIKGPSYSPANLEPIIAEQRK